MGGIGSGLPRLYAATLLFTLLLLPITIPLAGAASEYTVRIRHIVLGPVYQKLADGRVINVTLHVYYPDTLYYHGPDKGLGTVNFTVETNWTGPWNGILTVLVMDPGYHIDPTTLKPAEYSSAWAEGGAVIGTGNIHYAGDNPARGPKASTVAVVRPHTRYFQAPEGEEYRVQYFFKARLAFFKETGGKVLGGDVLVYTEPSTAPHALLVVNHEPPRQDTGGASGTPVRILAVSLAVAALAAATYLALDRFFSRRHSS